MRMRVPVTIITATKWMAYSYPIRRVPVPWHKTGKHHTRTIVAMISDSSENRRRMEDNFSNDAVRRMFNGGRFAVTLERATGNQSGGDEALWCSDMFDAEVYPDLPTATTLKELLAIYVKAIKTSIIGSAADSGDERVRSPGGNNEGLQERKRCLVRSVPVQISGERSLRRKLAAAAGVDVEGKPIPGIRPADVLLLLSGSHPARRLPLLRHVLPDVLDELRMARQMKRRYLIESSWLRSTGEGLVCFMVGA
ncbi:unnamed protein product [Discosporangium mesarthrocarpum]